MSSRFRCDRGNPTRVSPDGHNPVFVPELRGHPYHVLAHAQRLGDDEGQRETIARIRTFDSTNPEIAIDSSTSGSSLLSSPHSQRQYRGRHHAQSEAGSAGEGIGGKLKKQRPRRSGAQIESQRACYRLAGPATVTTLRPSGGLGGRLGRRITIIFANSRPTCQTLHASNHVTATPCVQLQREPSMPKAAAIDRRTAWTVTRSTLQWS